MIIVIDPEAKMSARDRALSRLAHAYIRREKLPSTVVVDSNATDVVSFLDGFRSDTRPASTAICVASESELSPPVKDVVAELRDALVSEPTPKPATVVSARDELLTRLVRANAQGEELPASVSLNGELMDTARFVASFNMDTRPAWPALAQHVEHVQSPVVSECLGPLL